MRTTARRVLRASFKEHLLSELKDFLINSTLFKYICQVLAPNLGQRSSGGDRGVRSANRYTVEMEQRDLSDGDFSRLVEEVKDSLVLPKESPINQFFLCPIGLVGAGKTTVLTPLAKELSLVSISGDEIRKLL